MQHHRWDLVHAQLLARHKAVPAVHNQVLVWANLQHLDRVLPIVAMLPDRVPTNTTVRKRHKMQQKNNATYFKRSTPSRTTSRSSKMLLLRLKSIFSMLTSATVADSFNSRATRFTSSKNPPVSVSAAAAAASPCARLAVFFGGMMLKSKTHE
jgi:hypothetical protein